MKKQHNPLKKTVFTAFYRYKSGNFLYGIRSHSWDWLSAYSSLWQATRYSMKVWSKKTSHGLQYMTLIAGFMAFTPFTPFTPFSQTNLSQTSLAFLSKNEPNYILQKQTTTLMAQTNIPSPNSPKKGPNMTYERVITAYSSTPEETDSTPFITASGSYVRFGVVAANWLPIGTAIRIPEYFGKQVFIVEDRMNIKHSNKLDVWLPSKEAAINFGRRITKIEIL